MMLGNLNVEDIEKRLGIDFPKEIREFMANNKQDSASRVENGKWHCFDIPFHIVCGDKKTAEKIYNSVKSRAKEVKERLRFSITS